MIRKRFTVEQIIGLLREADIKVSQGRGIAQICLDLFIVNDIRSHVHQPHSALKSGFGDIADSIFLEAAKQLIRALGEFEQGEYTLAEQHQEHLAGVLMSPAEVHNPDDLKEVLTEIADEQSHLSSELAELIKFKRQLLQISLYD